jgi:hypothetical protein
MEGTIKGKRRQIMSKMKKNNLGVSDDHKNAINVEK